MGINTAQIALTTGIISAATLLGLYLIVKKIKSKVPSEWVQVGKVEKLRMYPLKSGRRIELEKGEFTEVGIRTCEDDGKYKLKLRDRNFVIYGAQDNEFRTARTYPKMILIRVSVVGDDLVAFDAPDMQTLLVKIPNRRDNRLVPIECWAKERVPGVDCGDEAAAWISKYISNYEKQLRLAYKDDAENRRNIAKTHQRLIQHYTNLSNKSTGLFSDLTCGLLINQKSINDLNEKINNSSVTFENFRPNIVIDGEELKAFDEDAWDWIKIGEETIFRNVKECTRCMMTTISPETGARDKTREPLKTLESYRGSKGPDKSPVMGIGLEIRNPGTVKVGDCVYIPKKI